MLERINETANFLKKIMTTKPETAIILGSGLGGLVDEITDKTEIKYGDIPHFPVSTVEGHISTSCVTTHCVVETSLTAHVLQTCTRLMTKN